VGGDWEEAGRRLGGGWHQGGSTPITIQYSKGFEAFLTNHGAGNLYHDARKGLEKQRWAGFSAASKNSGSEHALGWLKKTGWSGRGGNPVSE
jgi:hypothetical protein